MKVAIVHDAFLEPGGAERVLMVFLSLFPAADVYVPVASDRAVTFLRAHTRGRVRRAWISSVPFALAAPSLIKPFLYRYWETRRLQGYDLVISSSHSFASHAVSTAPGTLHVAYIHTPPRYLYGVPNAMPAIRAPLVRHAFAPLMGYLRKKDIQGARRPHILFANSQTTRARINRFWHREATVLYPPVAIPVHLPVRRPYYYLFLSRLEKQKGAELAIRACNALHEPLVIVGSGSDQRRLRRIAGPTVTFSGRLPDTELAAVYAGAKALLYPAAEEDFGMVPVEAMAHGVPVIGHRSGGTAETVVEGKTGLLFEPRTVRALVASMRRFSVMQFYGRTLRRRASRFSEERFRTTFLKTVRLSKKE